MHPHNSIDTTAAWKKLRFILSVRSDFHMTDSLALAPYLFIICFDHGLQTLRDLIKANGFTIKKSKNKQYPTETIKDMDYADDTALLANTRTQSKSQLHSLEQAAGGIGLHVKSNKTKHFCFKREEALSTLSGSSLKLEDTFIYLDNSVSTTESDIDIRLAKAWTEIDRLSIKWKSDQFDKIKRFFFYQEMMV